MTSHIFHTAPAFNNQEKDNPVAKLCHTACVEWEK